MNFFQISNQTTLGRGEDERVGGREDRVGELSAVARLQRELVAAQVNAFVLFKLVGQPVNYAMVKVIASKVCITIG